MPFCTFKLTPYNIQCSVYTWKQNSNKHDWSRGRICNDMARAFSTMHQLSSCIKHSSNSQHKSKLTMKFNQVIKKVITSPLKGLASHDLLEGQESLHRSSSHRRECTGCFLLPTLLAIITAVPPLLLCPLLKRSSPHTLIALSLLLTSVTTWLNPAA